MFENWLLLTSIWLIAIIPILAWVRWLDRRSWPAWSTALDSDAREHYAYMVQHIESALNTVAATVQLADTRRSEGKAAEGARVLQVALRTIEAFVPTLVGRIEHWRTVSRAVIALQPIPPLRVRGFHLWQLSGLAAFHRAMDLALVTSVERFALRLRVLLGGFKIIMLACRDVGRRLRASEQQPMPFRQVRDLAADFGTLGHESLTTLHALLVSLPVATHPAPTKTSAPESASP